MRISPFLGTSPPNFRSAAVQRTAAQCWGKAFDPSALGSMLQINEHNSIKKKIVYYLTEKTQEI
jgi:hypothetical protein